MIIGFTGRKGSGKDTVASFLPFEFEQVKFAGALKDMFRAFLIYCKVDEETIERMVEGDLKEVPQEILQGKTPREFMQRLGTEFGRDQIGENLWVDAAMERAKSFDISVFTDVRFDNEASAVKREGGVVIRISRPQALANEFSDHPSEKAIDSLDVDHNIKNDGSLGQLKGLLSLALDTLGIHRKAEKKKP